MIAERTARIRARARELGFQAVGFARAEPADPGGHLRAWLERGAAGSMEYMARTAEERADPRRYVEGARSVVALAISYYRGDYRPEGSLKVSRYAVTDDYHGIIKKKVRKLRNTLLELDPGARVAPTVDTSPVLEREWAQRAGIAWIGKSTMAIGRELGTYTFLASLVTTTEFIYDAPHDNYCGSCTACLDACPTQAFDAAYQLDARRCITYWNVEERGELTAATPDFHGWVAGCDVCQEVCPWNKFARESEEPRFLPRPALTHPDRAVFTEADQQPELEKTLQGTPLQRTGAPALRRNALHILAPKNQR